MRMASASGEAEYGKSRSTSTVPRVSNHVKLVDAVVACLSHNCQ